MFKQQTIAERWLERVTRQLLVEAEAEIEWLRLENARLCDIVERWREITNRPHLIIKEEREVGNQMADEVERLRLENARLRDWSVKQGAEIERLRASNADLLRALTDFDYLSFVIESAVRNTGQPYTTDSVVSVIKATRAAIAKATEKT